MVTGLPSEAPKLSNIVGPLAIVLVAIGVLDVTPTVVNAVFPEPGAAESIGPRMVACGRVGKYRRYCGVGDSFVGPVEDPRRQWR